MKIANLFEFFEIHIQIGSLDRSKLAIELNFENENKKSYEKLHRRQAEKISVLKMKIRKRQNMCSKILILSK